MRHLVSGSLARRISWTLVTTLVLPLLILAMPPRQAHAQLSTPLKSVAVLDFGVLTNSPTSAILGRNATDATVVELQHTGRYDVTSRQALDQQLRDLDLSAPLDNIGIQKLGGALGVDYVASGDITAISFTENPRRAKVALSVRLTDVVSGELANGAIETGYSSASPAGFQADDDTLISQAIQEAAYSAVRTITQYTLPEATVLQNVDTTSVILNRGARDGLYAGLVMTVVRGRDKIGRIAVASVNESDSVARVLDYGKGIRPEDRAPRRLHAAGIRYSERRNCLVPRTRYRYLQSSLEAWATGPHGDLRSRRGGLPGDPALRQEVTPQRERRQQHQGAGVQRGVRTRRNPERQLRARRDHLANIGGYSLAEHHRISRLSRRADHRRDAGKPDDVLRLADVQQWKWRNSHRQLQYRGGGRRRGAMSSAEATQRAAQAWSH